MTQPPAAEAEVLRPDAASVPPGVSAIFSTRRGGVSAAPFDSLNLRHPALGMAARGGGALDDEAAVRENLRRFAAALGAQPVWLRQVHGPEVVRLTAADLARGARDGLPAADASFTTEPGIGCVVQVADCLPVLFASGDGRVVGAAHAGWRGLAAGVLERTLDAMASAWPQGRGTFRSWLGPCIGRDAFEVGADVLAAFGVTPEAAQAAAAVQGAKGVQFHRGDPPDARADITAARWFRPSPRADGSPRWRADLAALAVDRLRAAGVASIARVPDEADVCTVRDAERWFSFRRAPRSGRLAAAIAIRAR